MLESLVFTVPKTDSLYHSPDFSFVVQCAKTATFILCRYASEQCAIFSSYVPSIDSNGIGIQVQYSQTRLWQSCAIYCKVHFNNFSFYILGKLINICI